MTAPIDQSSNQTQTNWPVLAIAKNLILDEKNTTYKIIKLISSIIIFPLALLLDLTYKGAKFCWARFSLYVKASLAKQKEPSKKSLFQKIKSIWINHKKIIAFISAGVIFGSFCVFLYKNRPIAPPENLAKKYEDKLVEIARVSDARENCVEDIQNSFADQREKIVDDLKEVKKNQKQHPLIDSNIPFKKFTCPEDIEQADQELFHKKRLAIDECNKKFFQKMTEILWPIKNKKTYFQNLYFYSF